jgi:hypothetical protein
LIQNCHFVFQAQLQLDVGMTLGGGNRCCGITCTCRCGIRFLPASTSASSQVIGAHGPNHKHVLIVRWRA